MRFFLSDTLEFETRLTSHEVAELLETNTYKNSHSISISETKKLLEGQIASKEGKFRTWRVVGGVNGFMPIMHGRFYSGPSGTLISVDFKMRLMTRICLTVCLAMSFFGILTGLIVFDKSSPAFLLTATFVFGTIYCLALFSFNSELGKSKELLIKLLK